MKSFKMLAVSIKLRAVRLMWSWMKPTIRINKANTQEHTKCVPGVHDVMTLLFHDVTMCPSQGRVHAWHTCCHACTLLSCPCSQSARAAEEGKCMAGAVLYLHSPSQQWKQSPADWEEHHLGRGDWGGE